MIIPLNDMKVLRRVKADVLRQLVPKTEQVHFLQMTPQQEKLYMEILRKYAMRKNLASQANTSKKKFKQCIDLTNDDNDDYKDYAKKDDKQISTTSFQFLSSAEATHLFTDLRKAANHPLLLRIYYDDKVLDEVAEVSNQSWIRSNHRIISSIVIAGRSSS